MLLFSEFAVLLIRSLLFVSGDVNSGDLSLLGDAFSSIVCLTTCTAGLIQDSVVEVLHLYLLASILIGMQEFLI